MTMPCEDESGTYFTRSQIAIVKEAEALIMDDLTKRITAKEMANRFGISESSFKFYIKGILGDSYLTYFRKKGMEKAAELLESTFLKKKADTVSIDYRIRFLFGVLFNFLISLHDVQTHCNMLLKTQKLL